MRGKGEKNVLQGQGLFHPRHGRGLEVDIDKDVGQRRGRARGRAHTQQLYGVWCQTCRSTSVVRLMCCDEVRASKVLRCQAYLQGQHLCGGLNLNLR